MRSTKTHVYYGGIEAGWIAVVRGTIHDGFLTEAGAWDFIMSEIGVSPYSSST